MKKPHRQIAVIAPEQMQVAFAVLIKSAPELQLIASATGLEPLQAQLLEERPDAILIYLVPECESSRGMAAYEKINQVRTCLQGIIRIVVVKYAFQQAEAVEMGADLALVEGVSAGKLLAVLSGQLQN